MKLGDVLVQYRMEHNYSIREFAKICGLSPAGVPIGKQRRHTISFEKCRKPH